MPWLFTGFDNDSGLTASAFAGTTAGCYASRSHLRSCALPCDARSETVQRTVLAVTLEDVQPPSAVHPSPLLKPYSFYSL